MKNKETWESYVAMVTREAKEARQCPEAKRRCAIESGMIKGGVWWSCLLKNDFPLLTKVPNRNNI